MLHLSKVGLMSPPALLQKEAAPLSPVMQLTHSSNIKRLGKGQPSTRGGAHPLDGLSAGLDELGTRS